VKLYLQPQQLFEYSPEVELGEFSFSSLTRNYGA